jgi:hypothetical protein
MGALVISEEEDSLPSLSQDKKFFHMGVPSAHTRDLTSSTTITRPRKKCMEKDVCASRKSLSSSACFDNILQEPFDYKAFEEEIKNSKPIEIKQKKPFRRIDLTLEALERKLKIINDSPD